VDLLILVSNSDHRLDQNFLRNMLSQSKMMFYDIPKCTHNNSKNILEVTSIVINATTGDRLRQPTM
jgi:hypothetical protein